MSFNSAAALPSCLFLAGATLHRAPLPILIAEGTSALLPPTQALSYEGFNTLSCYVEVSGIPAGNTFIISIETWDPETGTGISGAVAAADIITETADGTYAATIYLPAYYNGLTGKILPFFQNVANVINDGVNVGTLSVNALKFWLSNA